MNCCEYFTYEYSWNASILFNGTTFHDQWEILLHRLKLKVNMFDISLSGWDEIIQHLYLSNAPRYYKILPKLSCGFPKPLSQTCHPHTRGTQHLWTGSARIHESQATVRKKEQDLFFTRRQLEHRIPNVLPSLLLFTESFASTSSDKDHESHENLSKPRGKCEGR